LKKSIIAVIAIAIVVIFALSVIGFFLFLRSVESDMNSVKIELDSDYGVYLNFSKLGLSENAIENISTSNFLIAVEFPAFSKSTAYSFEPKYENLKHSVPSGQSYIVIDNVNSYQDEKMYPFIIHFQIESNNDEISNLILLNGNNSIYGTIRFDLPSDDIDFFDGEYLRTQVDETILEFEYLTNEIEFKFIITKQF
jgi:hypothetical protein